MTDCCVQDFNDVDLLDPPKSGLFFNLTLLNPYKNSIFTYFMAKGGPFGRWGRGVHCIPCMPPPPLATVEGLHSIMVC